MATNLIAITQREPVYPGFVSINRDDDGSVTIYVREAPRHHEAARLCDRSCFPGQAGCNNWCGYDLGRAKPSNPDTIDIVNMGEMASLTISAGEWEAALAGLSAG